MLSRRALPGIGEECLQLLGKMGTASTGMQGVGEPPLEQLIPLSVAPLPTTLHSNEMGKLRWKVFKVTSAEQDTSSQCACFLLTYQQTLTIKILPGSGQRGLCHDHAGLGCQQAQKLTIETEGCGCQWQGCLVMFSVIVHIAVE